MRMGGAWAGIGRGGVFRRGARRPGGPGGSAAGPTGDCAGQLQPRHPADPLEQLLCLPRAGRKQRETKFHFDTKEGAFAKAGVIVPGNAAESLLIEMITHPDPEERMPPPDSGHALTDKQIELLKRWIDEGAKWDTHWAYTAPVRPTPPAPSRADWVRNPIDQFILARLEREGLEPSPEADKDDAAAPRHLDLTGLPPTPAEVDAFLADRSPDAYEKRVDALLQSPRYGERMAMPWLDAARYADTHGYHIDSLRGMWPWRDWVIDAFNRNLPFDQFIDRAARRRPAAGRDARAEDRLRVQPQPHDQLRGRRDRRGVSGRVRRRSRRSDLDGVHGPDDGVRALPRRTSSIPITPQGVLPVLRVLQQRAGARPRRPHRATPRRCCSLPTPRSRRCSTSSTPRSRQRRTRSPTQMVAPLQAEWETSSVGRRPTALDQRPDGALTSSTAASPTSPDSYQHGRTVAGEPTFDLGQIGRGVVVRRRHRGQLRQRRRRSIGRDRFTLAVVAAAARQPADGRVPEAGRHRQGRRGYEWVFDDIALVGIQRWAARLDDHARIGVARQRDSDSHARAAAARRLVPRGADLRRLGQGRRGCSLYVDGKLFDDRRRRERA